MTHRDLLLLVDYHYWARDRMLAALDPLPAGDYVRPLGNSFGSIRDTAVHIFFAEWAWLNRWHGVSPTAPLDAEDYPDVAALRARWLDHEARLRGFIGGLDDAGVTRRIVYKLLSGTESESAIWTMVQHVVNHASYHRGQVTTMVRQVGGEAPRPQDLIAFYRERGI
ncbi:MAG: DinB family protein [Acidobacteriota bacterium]|nr:DinB family protein [Acidobacteriota bacterium]